MDHQFFVSSSPHVFAKKNTSNIMMDVLIALLPATIAGAYFFGYKAIILIVLTTISTVFIEWIVLKMFNRSGTIKDLSAAVTGLLIALNLPSTAPWWMAVVAALFAILIVKHPFGGLGHNFINPALAGRVFLYACWPVAMTANYVIPGALDAVSAATPLMLLQEGMLPMKEYLLPLAIGNVGGSIGETSAIALFIGGIYLVARRIIRWRIPVTYILTVFAASFLLGGFDFMLSFTHVLAGGLMLGAIYMATDYSTSPVTPNGQFIMGIGCGILTVIIRLYSKSPEGVSFAILLMNIAVPLIDRLSRPKVFGKAKVYE